MASYRCTNGFGLTESEYSDENGEEWETAATHATLTTNTDQSVHASHQLCLHSNLSKQNFLAMYCNI